MRERPRYAFDISRQRRVVLDVMQGMFTHNIDDARPGLFGVVQIRRSVCQTRAQMQQGGSGSIGHAVIAIRRAAAHALEQAEHAAHALNAIQRANEMHFRRARVGKAHLHPAFYQCANQTFCAVHECLPQLIEFGWCPIFPTILI